MLFVSIPLLQKYAILHMEIHSESIGLACTIILSIFKGHHKAFNSYL